MMVWVNDCAESRSVEFDGMRSDFLPACFRRGLCGHEKGERYI